jgi:hypothetical protein
MTVSLYLVYGPFTQYELVILPINSFRWHSYEYMLTVDMTITLLWRAAHLCGQLPVLFINETSSNIVDTFVPCDPNMYSHLCTEIYLSQFTALD